LLLPLSYLPIPEAKENNLWGTLTFLFFFSTIKGSSSVVASEKLSRTAVATIAGKVAVSEFVVQYTTIINLHTQVKTG
jgi:hypothetical protein